MPSPGTNVMAFVTNIVPAKVGPYVFKGTVGSGSFSIVKVAVNEETKEAVACKIIARSRLVSEDDILTFENEVRVNRLLRHAGIVHITDLVKDDLNYYIFQEFCPNGDLYKYIVDRVCLTENESMAQMRQILESVAYLHSQNIAHLDIKPENILITKDDRLKISDFGLSSFTGSDGRVSAGGGTPAYMSPESITEAVYNGCKSDMWSLGVVMYAMLTGQLPWKSLTRDEMCAVIKTGEYDMPDDLSADCADLIKRMLMVDPAARITAEEALKHPWIGPAMESTTHKECPCKMLSMRRLDKIFGDDIIKDASIAEGEISPPTSQRPADCRSIGVILKRKIGVRVAQSMHGFPFSPTRTPIAPKQETARIPMYLSSKRVHVQAATPSVLPKGPKLVIPVLSGKRL